MRRQRCRLTGKPILIVGNHPRSGMKATITWTYTARAAAYWARLGSGLENGRPPAGFRGDRVIRQHKRRRFHRLSRIRRRLLVLKLAPTVEEQLADLRPLASGVNVNRLGGAATPPSLDHRR